MYEKSITWLLVNCGLSVASNEECMWHSDLWHLFTLNSSSVATVTLLSSTLQVTCTACEHLFNLPSWYIVICVHIFSVSLHVLLLWLCGCGLAQILSALYVLNRVEEMALLSKHQRLFKQQAKLMPLIDLVKSANFITCTKDTSSCIYHFQFAQIVFHVDSSFKIAAVSSYWYAKHLGVISFMSVYKTTGFNIYCMEPCYPFVYRYITLLIVWWTGT